MRMLVLLGLLAGCDGVGDYEAETVAAGRRVWDCTARDGASHSVAVPEGAIVQVMSCGPSGLQGCAPAQFSFDNEQTVRVQCSEARTRYLVRWIAPGGT